MTSLSPSLKRLIAQRPLPTHGPAQKASEALFGSFRSEAKERKLKDPVWITLTTAALFELNSPVTLSHLVKYVESPQVSKDQLERTQNAEILRETGLKCISFIGIAKVINNLAVVASAFDPATAATLRTTPRRWPTPENLTPTLARGDQLWTSIYQPHDKKLFNKLAGHHPDLPVHILASHYSNLLSDPPPPPEIPNVGRLLTSLAGIATLRCINPPVTPQVISHIFGLKKCAPLSFSEVGGQEINRDSSSQDPEAWKWLTENEGCEWVLGVVDRVEGLVRSVDPFGTGNDVNLKAKL